MQGFKLSRVKNLAFESSKKYTPIPNIFSSRPLYDAFVCYKKQENKILLRLPQPLKTKINNSIRFSTKQEAIILPALFLGVIVSLLELNCTGQIYLPAIMYILNQQLLFKGIRLLILYNLMFIAPLIIVGILSQVGFEQKGWAGLLVNNLVLLKIGVAFIFFFLGFAYLMY